MYLHYPWVFIPEGLEQRSCTIPDAEWHHLQQVLRCKPDDIVVAFDGQGRLRLGHISGTKKSGRMLFQDTELIAPKPNLEVQSVLFLPNNGATFEICLRKACELGVGQIQPVFGDHTEGKLWTLASWEKRQTRFQRICIESCKQAKNPFLPQLLAPIPSDALPALKTLGHCFYGSIQTPVPPLPRNSQAPQISIILGPEGGFSPREERFLETIATALHLPTHVLRVETAMVALHAVLQTHFFKAQVG